MQGTVFDIQRFCLDDGPGIRTTVFLKGCNLRCAWCHNPESLETESQLRCFFDKCTLCGICAKICPNGVHNIENSKHTIDFSQCTSCKACIDACPRGALEIVGRTVDTAHVLETVLRDETYFRSSGGGVTFSGGEPLVQGAFLASLLSASKAAGLHTVVETNGVLLPQAPEAILTDTDLFLLDYKVTGARMWERYLGRQEWELEKALDRLYQAGKAVILRMPILPGINDVAEHFSVARIMRKRYPNVTKIQIMPYHTTGVVKWTQVGLPYGLKQIPTATETQRIAWQAAVDIET